MTSIYPAAEAVRVLRLAEEDTYAAQTYVAIADRYIQLSGAHYGPIELPEDEGLQLSELTTIIVNVHN